MYGSTYCVNPDASPFLPLPSQEAAIAPLMLISAIQKVLFSAMIFTIYCAKIALWRDTAKLTVFFEAHFKLSPKQSRRDYRATKMRSIRLPRRQGCSEVMKFFLKKSTVSTNIPSIAGRAMATAAPSSAPKGGKLEFFNS
jgi:hypothetical protein